MDSWEDDDFDVPTFKAPPPVASNYDDEEEEEETQNGEESGHKGPPKMSKEKADKKKAEEDAAIAAMAELAVQANETPEERKLRERMQVEDADHSLTEELFGAGDKGGGGIESVQLKTVQDYLKVAVVLGAKMNKGKSINIVSFYKELLTHTEGALSIAHLDELSILMAKRKEAKEKESQKVKVAKRQDVGAVHSKKKKKEMEAKQKHEDVFGGVETDAIDNAAYAYEDAYDDFM